VIPDCAPRNPRYDPTILRVTVARIERSVMRGDEIEDEQSQQWENDR
jgi:hypothetical protein